MHCQDVPKNAKLVVFKFFGDFRTLIFQIKLLDSNSGWAVHNKTVSKIILEWNWQKKVSPVTTRQKHTNFQWIVLLFSFFLDFSRFPVANVALNSSLFYRGLLTHDCNDWYRRKMCTLPPVCSLNWALIIIFSYSSPEVSNCVSEIVSWIERMSWLRNKYCVRRIFWKCGCKLLEHFDEKWQTELVRYYYHIRGVYHRFLVSEILVYLVQYGRKGGINEKLWIHFSHRYLV